MFTPTRTPEGEPSCCRVCGKSVCIEPSIWSHDAPCPHCGTLLWFTPDFRAANEFSGRTTPELRGASPEVAATSTHPSTVTKSFARQIAAQVAERKRLRQQRILTFCRSVAIGCFVATVLFVPSDTPLSGFLRVPLLLAGVFFAVLATSLDTLVHRVARPRGRHAVLALRSGRF
ncbi:MAG: hypothetical protein KF688_09565 [Pirellulales bacterium]|nr:hypothetical protein [Pirellulales bacterium]